ncbi:hypothetical protein [Deinococcus kurensis]|uniref:hypothetical protein n=1 Tax=Deinococcus kurensis TaxID=2662757 RepID=UPI0012D2F168|nr:hypothetical protein [Deinococcus kurensis]
MYELIRNRSDELMYHRVRMIERVLDGQDVDWEAAQNLVLAEKFPLSMGLKVSEDVLHAAQVILSRAPAVTEWISDAVMTSWQYAGVLGGEKFSVTHPAQRAVVDKVLRAASVYRLATCADGQLGDEAFDALCSKVRDDRAAAAAEVAGMDKYRFETVYRKVLARGFPRAVTSLFSVDAASQGRQLPSELLAHAFPDFPADDPNVLALACTESANVLNSVNFRDHYEHLVLATQLDTLGYVSSHVLGMVEDVDLLWKLIYRQLARDERDGVKGKQWLYSLAAHYMPGRAFSQIDLSERAALNRRSTHFLYRLFHRALILGEVTDDLMEFLEGTNMMKSFVNAYVDSEAYVQERAKEQCPALCVVALSVHAAQ